jgi:aspartyl-tRNA synthetase
VAENTRLQFRYLDIRRERMQRNLRLRASVNSAIRRAMEDQGFVEVETPMLVPSTPEGAREFIVPSRQQPGSFYALPQSPQLFKQLLMVAGIDRYYQLARCLRDEDLRADRQYEFMQMDAEMSFVDQDDVHTAIGNAVIAAARAAGQDPGEIIKITWHDAMNRFGVDKPDLRFGMELQELTEVFAATEFKAFAGASSIKGINAVGKAEEYGRNKLDAMTDKAKKMGAKGLVWLKVTADGFESPVAKFLSDAESAALRSTFAANAGDLIFIVADEWMTTCEVLGQLRNDIGRPPVHEGPYRYLWVVDFPLFVGVDEASGRPKPGHHPFCQPHPDDVHLMETDPLKVRSQAYDLVLNGWELGSGSIRIHQPELQARIFQLLGISDEEAQKKFGFFLNPFKYGAPPHGGFAFGIDRLVAILAGEENIREVIAFPKTQSGADPMTNAPTPVAAKQLDELGIRVLPPKG